jgi:uncharacterized protein YdhG (YjbR/CyaY superfamily)
MTIKANNPDEYIKKSPEERQAALTKLREIIKENIPEGFKEAMSYGMIGYVVPHDLYPGGYHCDPKLPLPFVSLANQKNFIALYHMGIYANPELLEWWTTEYPKHAKRKLDMGKSCVRFKKMEDIPYDLIGELMRKITVQDWVDLYEANVKR